MRTTIDIDAALIDEAMQLSHISTKKEVVQVALEQFVKRLKRLRLLEMKGKVKWEGDLDEMRKI